MKTLLKNLLTQLVILLFLCPSLSFAGEDIPSKKTPKSSIPQAAFDRKSSGEFGAIMLIVSNENEIREQEKEGRLGLEFRTISSIKKGSQASVMFDLFGCKPNSKDSCEVIGDVVAYDPKGRIYFEQSNIPLMVNSGKILKGMYRLSAVSFSVLAEKTDAVGKYPISVKVRDVVANKEVALSTYFSIRE